MSLCLSVSHCQSVHPYFVSGCDNLSKHQWVLTKLSMCIDIVEVWFGIANGQFLSNFDRVICVRHTHILFPDDNLSKCKGILTKLGSCMILRRSCLGLLMGKFRQFFNWVVCPWQDNGAVLSFYIFILSFSLKYMLVVLIRNEAFSWPSGCFSWL